MIRTDTTVPTDSALASTVVLMVDDDEEDVYLTRRAFRDRPRLKSFHYVRGAAELIDYLERADAGSEYAPVPDLMLLDINMPGRSGFEVIEHLRSDQRWRGMPIVVLSTSSSQRDVDRAYACGANAFLAKPVTAAGMKELAVQVDAFWFNVAILPSLRQPEP